MTKQPGDTNVFLKNFCVVALSLTFIIPNQRK